MRPILTLITPPAAEPIDVDDVKLHLRIDVTDEDVILQSYLDTALGMLDGPRGEIGRALVTQTWRQDQAGPGALNRVCLEVPPVATLTAVEYVDTAGATQVANTADFQLIPLNDGFAYVEPKAGKVWPSRASRPDALRITFTAGTDEGKVPETIKNALRLLTGHFYKEREETSVAPLREIPVGVDRLLDQHRVKRFA